MLNYIHIEIEGGPLAATVNPGSAKPIDDRRYATDALAMRLQLDF